MLIVLVVEVRIAVMRSIIIMLVGILRRKLEDLGRRLWRKERGMGENWK